MSGLQKNVASQKWRVFAFNKTNNNAVTGDAANITAKIAKDHAAAVATNDVNPTETEDGYYLFDMTQAETNADVLDLYPESSTANVQVIGVPGTIYTVPANFADLGIESDGDLTKVNTLNGHTAQTGDTFAALPTNFGDLSITVTTGRVDVASIEGTDATNQIRDAVVDDATRIDASALNTASGAVGSNGSGLTEAGGTGDHLTAVPWNAAWDAEVESEVTDALVANHLDHLFAADYDPASKPGVATALLNELVESDGGVSRFTANALEQAPSGGGGSITDILNVVPLIPKQIDLADTATWRIGLMLTNAVDDLPSTAEITPGTISIDRKAIGGTSWSSVVSDSACSESAGLIYFDEVFDSGTGYAEGDSIRITLKSQKITVSANDYEITDATGRIFYTSIRQTMRGTDNALLAVNVPTNFADLAITASTGKVTVGTNDDKTGYSISGTKTTLDALNDITAAAVLAAGDIDGFTLENAMKIAIAALAGKLSGAATTTVTIRAADDSKDRITATVDADGNRSAVTLDASG